MKPRISITAAIDIAQRDRSECNPEPVEITKAEYLEISAQGWGWLLSGTDPRGGPAHIFVVDGQANRVFNVRPKVTLHRVSDRNPEGN